MHATPTRFASGSCCELLVDDDGLGDPTYAKCSAITEAIPNAEN